MLTLPVKIEDQSCQSPDIILILILPIKELAKISSLTCASDCRITDDAPRKGGEGDEKAVMTLLCFH